MKQILLGLSGSIACYKSAYLCRHLMEKGCNVQVVMTPNATRFISPLTMRALSNKPVFVEEWDNPNSKDGMDHITAARFSDTFIVAPASASFIAKAATGVADNVLLAAFLATNAQRYIAPAMNCYMWNAAVTQRNIEKLKQDGVIVLMPDSGEQACGDYGEGRMQEPLEIAKQLTSTEKNCFTAKKVVISTGATVSFIDPMRYISNKSSGLMGYCLAEAIKKVGGEPIVVAGQSQAIAPKHIPVISAIQNNDMEKTILEQTQNAEWFFSVAAVADFVVDKVATQKIERQEGQNLSINLKSTNDILKTVVAQRPHLKCLGFAAQNDLSEEQATKKMQKKGVLYMAVNHLDDAGKADSQLYLLHPKGRTDFNRQSKAEIANQIVKTIIEVSRETLGTLGGNNHE